MDEQVDMFADGNAAFSTGIGMAVDKGQAMGTRCGMLFRPTRSFSPRLPAILTHRDKFPVTDRFAMVVGPDLTVEWLAKGWPQSSAEEALAFLNK